MTQDDDRDAQALDRLAKSALDRFKTRLDWEWKARFGLWTALAAAAIFTLGSEKWRPTEADGGLVLQAMVVLVAAYAGFSFAVHMFHAEDMRLWYTYQLKTAALVWGTDPVPAGAKPYPLTWFWAVLLSVGQFLVTCLFAAALVFAVNLRATRPDADNPAKSKVTIRREVPGKVIAELRGK